MHCLLLSFTKLMLRNSDDLYHVLHVWYPCFSYCSSVFLHCWFGCLYFEVQVLHFLGFSFYLITGGFLRGRSFILSAEAVVFLSASLASLGFSFALTFWPTLVYPLANHHQILVFLWLEIYPTLSFDIIGHEITQN